jgi:hypothetical protein
LLFCALVVDLSGGALDGFGDDKEDDHQGTKTPRKELLVRDLRVSAVNLV